MTEKSSIKTILPIHNNEEKLEEINRLLDILSKRKRYSILVTMLLVFQKYKFQKLLKEFLVEGVQEIILANPFKVVSFSGVPFTIKNCFMGMRVIIGKHRIFNKELIEGYEYFNVNLVYTCIFLTDEIAKICKGSKNNKPVHSSLLDDLDIVENTNSSNNSNNNNNKITNPLSINNISNTEKESTNNKSNLNKKRKRSKSDEEEDYEEEEEPEEEEDLGNQTSAKKSGNSKTNNNSNNKNLGSNFNININISNSKAPSTTANKENSENEEHHSKKKLKKNSDNIISLGDSEESDETNKSHKNKDNKENKENKTKGDKNEKEKGDKKKNNKGNKTEKKSKKEQKPVNKLFANIFYDKDNNYFKCSLQDFLTVWNFDKSSPVNVYLKDNYQNISKIKNIFNLMQNLGEKGINYIENLIKYIPEMNPAANLSEEDKKKLDENPDLKESKEILDLVEGINSIYKEYDSKKKKLVNIYQRIRSIAENIKQGLGVNPGDEKLFLEEDLDYLDLINKRFEQIMDEMFPLFNQIYIYHRENMLKTISSNMNNLSRILKENDLTLKPFSIFTQNLLQLFPREPGSISTISDLMLTEGISVEDREKKFKEIILGEKNILINTIEQFKKYAKLNNGENQDDKYKELVVEG